MKNFINLVISIILIGFFAGLSSAVFLWALKIVTAGREQNQMFLWILPGMSILSIYIIRKFGADVFDLTSEILKEIYQPTKLIPFTLASISFGLSIISHLCGASVGREGITAQVGAIFADQIHAQLPSKWVDRKTFLMVGLSAGFAGITGCLLAGTVFGIEVTHHEVKNWRAWIVSLLTCYVTLQVMNFLGIEHMQFAVPAAIPIDTIITIKLVGFAFLCGMLARLFSFSKKYFTAVIMSCERPYLFPFVGSCLLVGCFYFFGLQYTGLGLSEIQSALIEPQNPWSFLIKFGLTVASLAFGFRGGEFIPLLFIGSHLGNTYALMTELPISSVAALGLVGVFAGAANVPLTSALLADYYFDHNFFLYALVVCFISFAVSGKVGVYTAQRTPKPI